MTDQIIFRGDAQFADTLSCVGAFDVNANFTCSTSGALSGITTINSSGLATLGSLSCDSAAISSITGVTSLAASGSLSGGSVSDGVASLDGSGNLIGGATINCTSVVCSGSISGDVNFDQLKVNNSITLHKNGIDWTALSNAPDNGSIIVAVTAHTGDDATACFICSKVAGSAGVCNKMQGAPGSTSSVGLSCQWTSAAKPEVKYTSSWGGGYNPTTLGAYATILFAST